MSGYVKVFSSILDSTVWAEPLATRIVWITLLAMADRDGVVEASVPGLAKRAGVERLECERALATFMAPDPDSRSREHEGRRLSEIQGGWQLLNYERYREKGSPSDKRAKDAARQRRKRERDREVTRDVTPVTHVTTDVTKSRLSEAEAEADPEADPEEIIGGSGGSDLGSGSSRARASEEPPPPPAKLTDSEPQGATEADARAVSLAWGRSARAAGCSALHGFEQWRRDFELVALALHESARGDTQLVALARTALCAWFWSAPSGPVQCGRVSAARAEPRLLAKHVSRDLQGAQAWWHGLTEAEQDQLLSSGSSRVTGVSA